ncbi:RNA polymerase sigma factor SigZ [Photobacterium marinum]|uniref:RNA polymerase sigma factor SigZ n=1 Tax=Photobacterium marinum TaxID=1056511 RepID=L8JF73_9GAMM|nr:RNA polymerase sigma factor SigZ [Photobacterium marinum]ELR66883.1 RNA polymerase sigma factor SigZ [Photobacterium marinum]
MNIEFVWKEYQAAIRAFLHSRVSDADDVDDLLQDILIKTYQNLHAIKEQDSIKSWLFQVSSNAIIDFYRDKAKTRGLSSDDLWYEQKDSDIKDALSPCLLPFIQALPADVSELISAIDVHGLSQKEYAEKQGISYSTLKSRVQKGRMLLRKSFEDCCHLSLDQHGNVIDCDLKSNSCNKC